MLRKCLIASAAAVLLSLPVLPNAGAGTAAASAVPNLPDITHNGWEEGLLKDGRLLVPLRFIAEHLDATVTWNPEQRNVVTIVRDSVNITVTADADTALVDGKTVKLDAPVRIVGGLTYAPLRFFGENLGADVEWDAKNRIAIIEWKDKRYLVTQKQESKLTNEQRMTSARWLALAEQLNQAADLSKFKQIRTHFRPYFTDRFINSLIQNKGLAYDYPFRAPSPYPMYLDDNTILLRQTSDSGIEGIPADELLVREAKIVRNGTTWKVDSVSFSLEPVMMP